MRVTKFGRDNHRCATRMLVLPDGPGLITEFWITDKETRTDKARRRIRYYKAMARRGLLKAARVIEGF